MNPEEPPQSSGQDQICLKGTLILAAPSLRESDFARSVLLLSDHNAKDGAHGYILNRPLEKPLSELLPSPDFSEIHEVPVYVGGPVSPDQLTFASFDWSPTNKLSYHTHLSADEAIAHHSRGLQLRAFVGYAGWSGGQLESELQQHAWITSKPVRRATDLPDAGAMWSDILESMGPYYSLLARTPDDPSLN